MKNEKQQTRVWTTDEARELFDLAVRRLVDGEIDLPTYKEIRAELFKFSDIEQTKIGA